MSDTKIKIKHDIDKIPILLDKFGRKVLGRAVASTIRRTFGYAVNQTFVQLRAKELVNLKTLTRADIKARFVRSSVQANANAPIGDMYAAIYFAEKHIQMKHFFAERVLVGQSKLTKAPLFAPKVKVFGRTTVMLKKRGSGNTYGAPFMPNNNKLQVLVKKSKSSMPVRNVWGPQFSKLMTANNTLGVVVQKTQEFYARDFERNISFFMGKL